MIIWFFESAIAAWDGEAESDHFGRVNFAGMALIVCDDEIWKSHRLQ
ncbi:MAG UNVERIFIED_CONTAM: hypothetical protein LVR29_12805 [Microcystis novacekii LVE1205-3]